MTTPVPTPWNRFVKLTMFSIVLAVGLGLGLAFARFDTYVTVSPAMQPTLLVGDRIIVDRAVYGVTSHVSDPVPGDVVVVRFRPDGYEDVKRVIGVAGDRIEIRDDVVYRNGVSIRTGVARPCTATDTTWDDPSECETIEETIGARTWRTIELLDAAHESLPEQTVPPGTVYVLGDHRDRSHDSRDPRLGVVPFARVRRATTIYWSQHLGRAGHQIE